MPFLASLRELDHQQRHTVLASFLGWTLDAFDYFLLTFVIVGVAQEFHTDDKAVTAYTYARTGYHRGLDQLRRNGWKGFGPVPYSHEPNRGFLRCVAALARAADAIGESDEQARCLDLLDDCDPGARAALGLS